MARGLGTPDLTSVGLSSPPAEQGRREEIQIQHSVIQDLKATLMFPALFLLQREGRHATGKPGHEDKRSQFIL